MTETSTAVFAVGDRVTYIGDFSPSLVGQSGVVTDVGTDGVSVHWENGRSVRVFPDNVAKASIDLTKLVELPIGTELNYVHDSDRRHHGLWRLVRHDNDGTSLWHRLTRAEGSEGGWDVGAERWFGNEPGDARSWSVPSAEPVAPAEPVATAEPVELAHFSSKEIGGVQVDQRLYGPTAYEEELAYAIHATKVAEGRLHELRAANMKFRRELDEFKQVVRDHVIATAIEKGWCEEGVNRHLEAVGLDEWQKVRDFDVELTITYTTTVTVEAEDEDSASEMVSEDLASYWQPSQYEEPYDITVDSVCES